MIAAIIIAERPLPQAVWGAAVSAFVAHPRIDILCVTLPEEGGEARTTLPPELLSLEAKKRIIFTPAGGSCPADHALHALQRALPPHGPGHVLIHDAARPWVSAALIDRVIDAALRWGAAIPVVPLTETPKKISGEDGGCFVKEHLKRAAIYCAQTPQGFAVSEIHEARYAGAVHKWASVEGDVQNRLVDNNNA
jgi:2-C-methyl-D-erythritol 4-phosphate cytidylyltransferase/2-C-methyl-D-erythritol 2,4-cyclodiphosphate synthase